MEADTYPKKFFWRRVGALTVDWVLVTLLFMAVFFALKPISPVTLIPPYLFKNIACTAGDEALKNLNADEILPLKDGEVRVARRCKISFFGMSPYHTQTIGGFRREGGITKGRSLTFYVDAQGKPIKALTVEAIMMLLGPFIFAFFLSRRGQTPGKMMVGLSVERENGATPGFGAASLREVAKYAPLMLAAAYSFFHQLSYDTHLEGVRNTLSVVSTAGIGWIAIPLLVGTWIYWLFPFLRWRGRTFYDRWLGLLVRRRELRTDRY